MEEFVLALRRSINRQKGGVYEPGEMGEVGEVGEVEVGDQELQEVFLLIDEDGSGAISSTEFLKVFKMMKSFLKMMNLCQKC